MKIDASKNSTENIKDPNVYKTPKSLYEPASPAGREPAATGFARILDEKRPAEKSTGKDSAGKETASDSKTETAEAGSKDRVEQTKEEKRHNREGRGETGEQSGGEGENPLLLIPVPPVGSAETAAETTPAARQILHVADLERIVSTIRSESFQTEKRVTIALRNSILEGLQIRLTVNENGRLKAEFLAGDEQTRKQLDRRKNELSEILRQRSKAFSEVEINFRQPPPDEQPERPAVPADSL
ncbi:MAG: hypothetical protein JSS81_18275 [Acidobacteria bacterium]|nr:hypothetical protein [Acidobacteriota bacterium]